MKRVFKFLGIIALVAVIGFTMAACGDGGSGGDGDGGGGSGAWADLVGEWEWKSGEDSASLRVNPVTNATIGGTIQTSHNVGGSMGGGSWIQCSVSGTTLKIDNGEKTFTISLSSDKKTLTLSNYSGSESEKVKPRYEHVYTKKGGEQPNPPNPPATSLAGTRWTGSMMGMSFVLTFTDTTYLVEGSGQTFDSGTYTVSGSTINFVGVDGPLTGTLSGNTLIVTGIGTFTKQ